MMHKGHTGFYDGVVGSTWLDFKKGEGWWVGNGTAWESFHTDVDYWPIEATALSAAALVLPEEYLK